MIKGISQNTLIQNHHRRIQKNLRQNTILISMWTIKILINKEKKIKFENKIDISQLKTYNIKIFLSPGITMIKKNIQYCCQQIFQIKRCIQQVL